MHFAICDDNPRDRSQLVRTIEKFAQERNIHIRMQEFENAEDMLRAAAEQRFTHYFLDVMMPCMDGITAAHEIRSFDAKAKIIFLTSFREYAYQGFRVKAYDYLLKPVENADLAALLEQLQAEEDIAQDCLYIQHGRSVFRIPLAMLSHLEVNQKKLYFHMIDGQIRQLPGTLAEFERDLLSRNGFIKIHRSYIVNLNHISMFAPGTCIMFSGENLPVSRLLYNQVHKAYMEHLFRNSGVDENAAKHV